MKDEGQTEDSSIIIKLHLFEHILPCYLDSFLLKRSPPFLNIVVIQALSQVHFSKVANNVNDFSFILMIHFRANLHC